MYYSTLYMYGREIKVSIQHCDFRAVLTETGHSKYPKL